MERRRQQPSSEEVSLVRARAGKDLVIAFFDNPGAGEVVARVLAEEARAVGKRGTVGMLMFNPEGRIDVARLGDRTAEGTPGVGAVLGMIAAALTGGVLPRRGRFLDVRSDLSTDDVARFGAELDAGQAAVAVLDVRPEAERVIVRLTELGGKTEAHRLTRRGLQQAGSAPPIPSP